MKLRPYQQHGRDFIEAFPEIVIARLLDTERAMQPSIKQEKLFIDELSTTNQLRFREIPNLERGK
jgi:hypothetical protein